MTLTYYLKIFNEKEKKEIVEKLNEQFGIKNIPGIITMRGKERFFLFTGNLEKSEIEKLQYVIPIERVGVYFAKIQGADIRLSIEGVQLLKDQITKNIFEINEKEMQEWMSGNELLFSDIEKSKIEGVSIDDKNEGLIVNNTRIGGFGAGGGGENKEIKKPHGFIIMKHKDDFLGTGKASEEKITNFISKSRRLKNKC